jgi:hypothetical protein
MILQIDSIDEVSLLGDISLNVLLGVIKNKAVPVLFLIGVVGGGVQLGPLGTAATNGLLCQPRVIMMMEKLVNDDWQGKPKYSEKTCPVPLCRPQTPHAVRMRTWAAAVGSQQLTA